MSATLERKDGGLRASDYGVRTVSVAEAKSFIFEHHYAKGSSNTAVYAFGLFHRILPQMLGVTVWLPPTRVAAESVDRDRWQKVLALSRMAVHPAVPRNACSFMLSRAVRAIARDSRFVALVTYADESQGHFGGVYRAAGWEYVGRTGAQPRWVDPVTGRQVATQSTTTRKRSEMEALGYLRSGPFHKHKFIKRLTA